MNPKADWTTGTAYRGGNQNFTTLNPPVKKVEEKPFAPKDVIRYREIFTIRPVYQTHDGKDHYLPNPRFLGYQLVHTASDYFWKIPVRLEVAKGTADTAINQIRNCEAIARALVAIGDAIQYSTAA